MDKTPALLGSETDTNVKPRVIRGAFYYTWPLQAIV
ncbi:hypothetical protein SAMN04488505_10632 [Chitinophaga rupis]|uniref:Uncharacterized protein n=1 Tax=Chitinophaga rupis TaxID=573321 RepID=A0A1H8AXZ9_9BACT|nr:hypothetical protein SAMN04488505_10632 [Chitinophaga rupis]